MTKTRKMWVYSPPKPPAPKVPPRVKADVQQKANELVEAALKPKHIQRAPAPNQFQHNYLADIYTKWYRHYFYFCAKYCVPGPNALMPLFEAKFARLEYSRVNRFKLSFMRHTGEWVEVYSDLTLKECLAAIRDDPFFIRKRGQSQANRPKAEAQLGQYNAELVAGALPHPPRPIITVNNVL